jgi:Ca-activated chloride channel homolog
VRDAIAGLDVDGSTNTAAGLLLGHEQAAAAHRDGDNSMVVLLADGKANVGMVDPDEIVDAIADVDTPARIVTHTVGIGMEVYNDALLETVANDSGGTYAYIDGAMPDADLLFDRDLPLLAPVAHDVKAQVEFDPQVVSAYRLIGYENRQIDADDFRDDDVTGGFVGAGHAVTALYEVRYGGEGPAAPSGPAGTVTVRWADPADGDTSELAADIDGDRTDVTFDLAAAMGALAESLRDSSHAVVSLDEVADRLDRVDDDRAAALASVVRAAAGADQAAGGSR